MCKQLNQFFKPSKQNENALLWEKFDDDTKACSKGTTNFILRGLGITEYDRGKLFPEKRYRFHNDAIGIFLAEKNMGRVWKMYEIEEFFRDVYSYSWGNGSTKFIYEERFTKQFGLTRYRTIGTVITSEMPFSKPKTDIQVKVYPGLDEQLTFVRKLINKKLDKSEGDDKIKAQVKFKEKLQTLLFTLAGLETTTEKYKLLEETIGSMIHPKPKLFSQLLAHAKQTGKLKSKYHNFTTVPYLNIFPGFSLQRFRNTDVYVCQTTIWEWLFVVWCNRDKKKLNWLLNYFATKIQQPGRKVMKYLVAYGRATGSGKSTFAKFCKALVDEDKVLFCKNLEDFLGEQNSEHLNKLFVLIDEIERATKSQSDKLKSSITADSFRYKKLYENPIQMPSYTDLIATSNCRSPVFVSSQNRRVELITINPEKKGDEAFWDSFYKELKDSRVMGAWFHFFATFPIDVNVRSENNRFDAEVLCSDKVKSMKSTHQFVVKFFSDPRCFEDACLRKCDEAHWFKDLIFRVTDPLSETCKL